MQLSKLKKIVNCSKIAKIKQVAPRSGAVGLEIVVLEHSFGNFFLILKLREQRVPADFSEIGVKTCH